MKVLIIGATGFVGFPVAQAYVRAGHEVYGVTRSESKATKLQAEEITPVVCTKPEDWAGLVEKLDIIIDAGATTGPGAVYKNLEVAAEASRGRREHLKLTYIFTSGTWSYGDSNEWKDERNARYNPATLVGWRPACEDAVISSKDVNGIVIRSAMVYGRSGSIAGMLFKAATSAKDGVFTWAATPGKRWATIHQDDLADFFLRVGEAAPTTKHTIFDAANNATESVEDICTQVGKLVGVKHTYRAPANPFEEAVDTQTLTRPSLGAALLGWKPRKSSLVDGLPGYFKAWEASLSE